MIEQQSSYRQIMKATSIFGGVQVFNIIIGIIRSKFIAVLLGTVGIGITGLYTSATSLIQGFTAMGLSTSAVKSVAEAYGNDDDKRLSLIVTVFKRLVWITGLFGMLFTILISPLLSFYTFGNYDYTIPFIFLSVTLLLQQISIGQSVVLQGTRKLNHLAKSGVIGSTIGLVITVPLYYFFGIKGIVPTLILNAVITLILTWWFAKKIKIEKVKITPKQTFQEGKEMLKMGIAMSLNSVLVLGVSYLLRAYISHRGGIEEVGLFSAGFAIVNTYVGLIFAAMTTDYYPRLASVNKDNIKCREVVNQQSEIAVLIMSPLVIFFLVFMPFIVIILYSNKFDGTIGYMQWAIMGMLFKTASWAIAYQFIAKGESKLFITNEIMANIYALIFNVVGYMVYGLDGLGISFVLSNLVYLIQVFVLAKLKYNFSFSKSFITIFFSQNILIAGSFFCVFFLSGIYLYTIGIVFVGISAYLTYRGIDRRIGIKELINNLKRK
jgi:O-antigen/teichoic acid export membrane protein